MKNGISSNDTIEEHITQRVEMIIEEMKANTPMTLTDTVIEETIRRRAGLILKEMGFDALPPAHVAMESGQKHKVAFDIANDVVARAGKYGVEAADVIESVIDELHQFIERYYH